LLDNCFPAKKYLEDLISSSKELRYLTQKIILNHMISIKRHDMYVLDYTQILNLGSKMPADIQSYIFSAALIRLRIFDRSHSTDSRFSKIHHLADSFEEKRSELILKLPRFRRDICSSQIL
jgi:hypothetical protein